MNKAANCALILIALAMSGAAVSYHFTLEARFTALQQKLDQNAVALQQCQISQETAASSKADALNELSRQVDSLQTSLQPLGKVTQEQTTSLTEIRKQVAALQQSQVVQQDSQKKISEYAGQLDKIKHDIVAQVVQTPLPVKAPVVAPVPAPAPGPLATTPTPLIKPVSESQPMVETKPVALVKPATPAPVITPVPAPAPIATAPPIVQPVTSPVAMPVIHPRASAVNSPQTVPVRADNAMIDLRPDETIRTVSTMSVKVVPVELSQK